METRSLYVVLSANVGAFTGRMVSAGKVVDDFGNKVVAMSGKQAAAWDNIGRSAGRAGFVAAAGLALIAKAAIDWESQFRGVQKTVNGTTTEINALEGDLRGLARTMPATHEEIAGVAEAAGQLGIAVPDIANFTKIMVEMGAATNLSAEDAATSIAQFMNVMQSSAGDVDNIANTIVDLGNKGASTESQITAMTQRLAGAGATVGATEDQILGLAAAMSNLGIQAELGGGAVQRIFVGIESQVKSGGDKIEAYAQVAGMSAREFSKAWSSDPIRAFDSIVTGLNNIQKSGGNVVGALDQMGIKGTQNLQVMLRLASSGDMLTRNLDEASSAWAKNNALFREYALRAETDSSKIQVAWNNIKDAAIDAGGALLPVIAKIAETVAALASAFETLPGPVKETMLGLLAITALVGGATWFGVKVITAVRNTGIALASLRGEETAAAASTRGLGGSIQGLIADLRLLATEAMTAGTSTEAGMARASAARGRVMSALGKGARAGALVGGTALLATGALDKSFGNTASMALIGSAVLPGYGTAIGAVVGATMDLAKANNEAAGSIKALSDVMANAPADFEAQAQAIAQLRSQANSLQSDVEAGGVEGLKNILNPDVYVNAFRDTLGLESIPDKMKDAADAAEAQSRRFQGALYAMGTSLGEDIDPSSLDDLGRVATAIQPALDDLGLSIKDITLNAGVSGAKVMENRAAVQQWMATANSGAGAMSNLGDAVSNMGSDMADAASMADNLKDALDQLLGVNLSLSAAQDQFSAAMRDMKKELSDAGAGSQVLGKGAGPEAARGVIRDRISDLEDLMQATAQATQDPEKVARVLQSGTKAIIEQGRAAGLNEQQLRKYIRTMGLTPDLVQTVFEAAGLDYATEHAKALIRQYNALPKKVRTEIAQHGGELTKSQVRELQRQYDLTPKQIHTIIAAMDNSTITIKGIQALLKQTDRQKATPEVQVQPFDSVPLLGGILGMLGHIDGYHATASVTTTHTTVNVTHNVGDETPHGTSAANPPPGPKVPRTVGRKSYPGIASREPYHRGGGGTHTTVVQKMPGKMQIVLDDGTQLSGYVRGHATDVARDVVDQSAVSDRATSRMGWG